MIVWVYIETSSAPRSCIGPQARGYCRSALRRREDGASAHQGPAILSMRRPPHSTGAYGVVRLEDHRRGQRDIEEANRINGITSVEQGGKRVAREVHAFADLLRGLAEGHYPWDLESEPNMTTNANSALVSLPAWASSSSESPRADTELVNNSEIAISISEHGVSDATTTRTGLLAGRIEA